MKNRLIPCVLACLIIFLVGCNGNTAKEAAQELSLIHILGEENMVSITDAKQIIRLATDAEIKVFLDGGWGVDCLLYTSSRNKSRWKRLKLFRKKLRKPLKKNLRPRKTWFKRRRNSLPR